MQTMLARVKRSKDPRAHSARVQQGGALCDGEVCSDIARSDGSQTLAFQIGMDNQLEVLQFGTFNLASVSAALRM